jgi:regulator of protease activity HflC (stomatin/prohibitin superfamily)
MITQEKTIVPQSGYAMILSFLVLLTLTVVSFFTPWALLGLIFLVPLILIASGFFIVNPNGSKLLVLFGNYQGTVKKNGFYWSNPFLIKTAVSLRARNFDSERLKVNDKLGNPIMISVILVWQVNDTFKAAFDVDDYEKFVRVQSDAAVRKMAGSYPYDNMDDPFEITLRSGMEEVNHKLEAEITERLEIAGIRVIEARIGYLAYATEIASAMLRRQQATAIVAARHKIVEGAVGMVEMALEQLSKKQIITLDEDKKAAMVSNLMVVLCSDKDASPVLNTGTLNS